MEFQTLLYDVTHKLPDEIWSREDVMRMINIVEESQDYLHNIWGDWMRARDKLIISMLFEHAMRPKELLCMKFDDLDVTSSPP